jgi:hypothetical protein
MRRFVFASLFVPSLVVLGAACGDDGGSGPTDARHVGSDAPVECAADAAYGSPKGADAYALRDADTNPENIFYNGSMNMDYDDLTVELYKGYGTYADTEIVTGTVQLTGDESAYDTCGACVLIYANWDRDAETADMTYLAIGGTLNITSLSPNITGNILNATFVHVDIDSEGVSTPSPDACMSSVASFSFDTMVETQAPDAFAPSLHRPHGRHHRHRS